MVPELTRHLYIVLFMHTQLFYWAAQILHRVFDIPIWIPALHLDDDDDVELISQTNLYQSTYSKRSCLNCVC